jgi:hypothetical protein
MRFSIDLDLIAIFWPAIFLARHFFWPGSTVGWADKTAEKWAAAK